MCKGGGGGKSNPQNIYRKAYVTYELLINPEPASGLRQSGWRGGQTGCVFMSPASVSTDHQNTRVSEGVCARLYLLSLFVVLIHQNERAC